MHTEEEAKLKGKHGIFLAKNNAFYAGTENFPYGYGQLDAK